MSGYRIIIVMCFIILFSTALWMPLDSTDGAKANCDEIAGYISDDCGWTGYDVNGDLIEGEDFAEWCELSEALFAEGDVRSPFWRCMKQAAYDMFCDIDYANEECVDPEDPGSGCGHTVHLIYECAIVFTFEENDRFIIPKMDMYESCQVPGTDNWVCYGDCVAAHPCSAYPTPQEIEELADCLGDCPDLPGDDDDNDDEPFITVTEPSAGDNWPIGSIQTISWNQANPEGWAIRASLFKGGQYEGRRLCDNLAADAVSCEYLVEADIVPGNDYTVQVYFIDHGAEYQDFSESFSIVEAGDDDTSDDDATDDDTSPNDTDDDASPDDDDDASPNGDDDNNDNDSSPADDDNEGDDDPNKVESGGCAY